MKLISGWIRETRLNFNFEMLSFLLHRVTGIGLILFLVVHLFSLGTKLHHADTFNATMNAYNHPLFHFGEWMLFLCVVFHLLNGIRIILVDFFPLTGKQKEFTFWVVAFSALGAGFSALFFFETIKEALGIFQF